MAIMKPRDWDEDIFYNPSDSPAVPIHFKSVTNSAFNFFQRAFQEIAAEPKYSVIHFYTGIELLFKARLLHEHWTLVVAKPETASLNKFHSGDFQSVTLAEAIQRLRNVTSESFSKQEQECFENLRRHRNRIVHFFHEGYVGKPNPDVVAKIAAEQFRAWVYVHRLVTRTWAEHFVKYQSRIQELDRQIARNKHFLAAKYDLVKPELKKYRRTETTVEACNSCGYQAAVHDVSDHPLQESCCRVCDHRNAWITMECDQCNGVVEFEAGAGTCPTCKIDYDLDDLLKHFSPDRDPREDSDTAYCPNCERTDSETVVPHDGTYVCLNCAETFVRIGHCGYCSSRIAGELEDSYLIGCMFCSGRMGDDRD